MPVVTIGLKDTLGDRSNAWLQILDDVNSINIEQVKDIADNATLVKTDKLSNPSASENIDYSNRYVRNILDKAKQFAEKYKLNETQLKNLNCKVSHWVTHDFKTVLDKLKNGSEKLSVVYTFDKIGKHDWLVFNYLRSIGINILIITKDFSNISYAENPRVIKLGTTENLSITREDKVQNNEVRTNNAVVSIELQRHKELYMVEKEMIAQDGLINKIKDHAENIKLSVVGTSVLENSLVFASKLKDVSKDIESMYFIEERIPKPTIDETSKVYRVNRDNIEYIVSTLKKLIKCCDKNIEALLGNELEKVLRGFKASGDTSSIIYNKGTVIVCWINRYMVKHKTTIIFYGKPKENETILLNLLSKVNDVNIVIISGDKQGNNFKFNRNEGINIELEDSCENTSIDLVSSDTATTMAYNASKIADRTLYGENTIGLYKEGQIVDCTTKHLACTFDETVMWWNKEMFIRPGYKQGRNSVEIPVQFGVIRGVNGTEQEYIKTVQRYCCGKTVIYRGNGFYSRYKSANRSGMRIHNCTDINGTLFSEQKPYIVGGKLQTRTLKSARNFGYKFLDTHKQDFILSKIQEIIDDPMLLKPHEYKNEQAFYNMMLDITLNLDLDMVRTIQWFNYTDYNPNIVVISNDENTLTFEDTLYLRFLSKLGFDILIFVPTQYSSVEKFLNNTEYEIYDIGRPQYQINTSNLQVVEDVDYAQKQTQAAEKKGWFSKLFN